MEWRTSQPYGYAEFASLLEHELVSPAPMHQMFPSTLWPPEESYRVNGNSDVNVWFLMFVIHVQAFFVSGDIMRQFVLALIVVYAFVVDTLCYAVIWF